MSTQKELKKPIKKSARMTDKGIRNFQWNSMVLIPVIMVFIFNYVPMYGIIIAFKKYKYARGILGSEWCGFDNFKIFLRSQDLWMILRNTIFMNILFIITGMIAALALAVLLFELKSTLGTKIYQTMMITPNFVSWVIGGYVVYALLNPSFGTVNGFLRKMGMPAVRWYSRPELWPGILCIANIWKGVGMASILYYAALMGIDTCQFEAAELDGASKMQRIRYIILPHLSIMIGILLIMKVGSILSGDFGLFYQLTRNVGELRPTTEIIQTYTYRMFREKNNPSLATAIGLMQSVVGLTLTVLANKVSKLLNEDGGMF